MDRPVFHNRYISHLSKFDQEVFCNFIHKKKTGHILVAQYLKQYLPTADKKSKLIWAMGGSTTWGKQCWDEQCWGKQCGSGTTWPMELQKLFPNDIVVNYGKGTMNSDYSVKLLEKNLMKKSQILSFGHIR